MHGTFRKPDGGDRALVVNLLTSGLPAQFVTQVTGVHASSLMALADLSPRRRTAYEAPPPAPTQHQPLRFGAPMERPRTRADQVLDEVAAKHGLTVADLKAKRATRDYSWPRQEAMYRLHKELGISSTVTGRILGGRDHTTVMHGARRHAERMVAGD